MRKVLSLHVCPGRKQTVAGISLRACPASLQSTVMPFTKSCPRVRFHRFSENIPCAWRSFLDRSQEGGRGFQELSQRSCRTDLGLEIAGLGGGHRVGGGTTVPHASPTSSPAAHTTTITVYLTSAAPGSTLGSEAALIGRRRGRPSGLWTQERRSLFTRLCRGVSWMPPWAHVPLTPESPSRLPQEPRPLVTSPDVTRSVLPRPQLCSPQNAPSCPTRSRLIVQSLPAAPSSLHPRQFPSAQALWGQTCRVGLCDEKVLISNFSLWNA